MERQTGDLTIRGGAEDALVTIDGDAIARLPLVVAPRAMPGRRVVGGEGIGLWSTPLPGAGAAGVADWTAGAPGLNGAAIGLPPDATVTVLHSIDDGLMVGTAAHGLFLSLPELRACQRIGSECPD